MAQGDSIVGICNAALVALGEDLVTGVFPPDATKRAILCNLKYDQVRREVLASSPWRCAMRQAQLAASAVAPPIGQWTYAYPLPVDCIRVYNLPDNDQAKWEIQNPFGTGRCLMTNAAPPLDVLYVFDLADPTLFEPLLAKAIARGLAVDLAEPLTESNTKSQLAQAAAKSIEDARLTGSQEGSPMEWDEDIWLRSRF